jgi:hypothetical protein
MLVFLLQIADQEIGKMKNLKKENQMSVTIIAGTNGFKSGRMTRVFKGVRACRPRLHIIVGFSFVFLPAIIAQQDSTDILNTPPCLPCLYHCCLNKALQKRRGEKITNIHNTTLTHPR